MRRLLSFAGAAALSCTSMAQAAETASAPPSPGWSKFVEAVRTLPDRLLDRIPENRRNDPQVREEAMRVALAAIAATSLDALGGDGDHPAFLPQVNQVLNVAQPNADTTYRIARITPGGIYRIRGRRGSLRMALIAEGGLLPSANGASPSPNPGPAPIHDLSTLHVDGDGRFDVIVGGERPAGYAGDWWPLRAGTDRLLLRLVSADWGREIEPTISIERLDLSANRPRLSTQELEQRLQRLPDAIDVLALTFVGKVALLREAGVINRLRRMETSALSVPGQMYYEGAYELADDEALIIEATPPPRCLYRSIILTNDVYETTDWYNNQSSLNDAQAAPDADGILRVVVSARDPGVPNWLDTAGYPSGSIQGRWTGCDDPPVPTVRKVAFAQLVKVLPAGTARVTPAQRQTIIRERRAALQQRPLW